MMRDNYFHLILMVAALIRTDSALAQMPDPMRPADQPAAQPASDGTAKPADGGAQGVQVVILRSAGRSAAVVNGRQIEVGGKLGDKRVLKISESEVVLKGANGYEVIKVTPAIEKIPSKPAVASRRRAMESAE